LNRGLLICGIKPDLVTLLGVLVTFMVPVQLVQGRWLASAIWLLAGGFFDVLDGSLARAGGVQSRFGAFWDSTLDRVSEAVVFGGFLMYYATQQRPREALLAFGVCVLSFLVSYTRARAEGLGVDCEVGLLPRPGRVFLLAFGLMAGLPAATLALLAVLSGLTLFQRVFWVYKKTLAG
jgi:CDP-diacylglycerol--glycerol-3-phosphate 3-phosphatidyltransferase